MRLEEARRAAEFVCTPSLHHAGVRDQGSEAMIEPPSDLVDLLRRLGATAVPGHPPGDHHIDHLNASELLRQARCATMSANLAGELTLPATPHLAGFVSEQRVVLEPHPWIDIIEKKSGESHGADVRRRLHREGRPTCPVPGWAADNALHGGGSRLRNAPGAV